MKFSCVRWDTLWQTSFSWSTYPFKGRSLSGYFVGLSPSWVPFDSWCRVRLEGGSYWLCLFGYVGFDSIKPPFQMVELPDLVQFHSVRYVSHGLTTATPHIFSIVDELWSFFIWCRSLWETSIWKEYMWVKCWFRIMQYDKLWLNFYTFFVFILRMYHLIIFKVYVHVCAQSNQVCSWVFLIKA